MAELVLSQREADSLFALEKHRVDEKLYEFPDMGGSLRIPLIAVNGREEFQLTVYRGKIDLAKVTYQNLARQVVVLARIDLGGAPHRNPDGEEIPSPHLHLYREGFGDKYAIALPKELAEHSGDHWDALNAFLRFCHITVPPNIDRGLFT